MKKILIAGAGNIGYWHYIALTKIKNIKLKIYIYDVKKVSFNKFKETKNKNIYFLDNLKKTPKDLDLAIISSTSKKRFKIAERVFFYSKVKNFIIEKIVAQSKSELDNFLSLSKKTNLFISIPYFCSKFFILLKKKNIYDYKLKIESPNLDLACNSFHFVILSSWLLNQQIEKVDISKLKKWQNAKRKGFYDVIGTIKFFFKGNSYVRYTSDIKKKKSGLKLKINKQNYIINNKYTTIKYNRSVIKSNDLSVSNVMNLEVKNILKNKNTKLPKFETIYNNHLIYINSLLLHFNKNRKSKTKILPIT